MEAPVCTPVQSPGSWRAAPSSPHPRTASRGGIGRDLLASPPVDPLLALVSAALVITRIVGLLHEHLVLLGHQRSLAALGLAEQDGGVLGLPVPAGRVLRGLPAGWLLLKSWDVAGGSEIGRAWCEELCARACAR